MIEAGSDTYGWTKERVLRYLLDPDFGIPSGASLNQVAKETGAAYGWVHSTWKDLLAAEAFVERSDGFRLKNPQAAFAYWLKHRAKKAFRDYHVLDGLEFLKGIVSNRELEYAATTYLAENLIQGHLFPRRFDLYIRPTQAATWHHELSKRGFLIDSSAEGRGTIRLLVSGDPQIPDEVPPVRDSLMLRDSPNALQPIRDFWIVRPPLLIVDLLEEGGPCVEAAEMLLKRFYAKTALHRS